MPSMSRETRLDTRRDDDLVEGAILEHIGGDSGLEMKIDAVNFDHAVEIADRFVEFLPCLESVWRD